MSRGRGHPNFPTRDTLQKGRCDEGHRIANIDAHKDAGEIESPIADGDKDALVLKEDRAFEEYHDESIEDDHNVGNLDKMLL